MYGYIYLTTNLINGKKYIGRKKSSKFLGNQYLGSGKHLNNAIRKYGPENFEVAILKECESPEDLYFFEEKFIKECNAVSSSEYYNHSPGGKSEGFLCGDENIINIPEVKDRMIASKKGSHWSDQKRQTMETYYKTSHEKISSEAKRRMESLRSDPVKWSNFKKSLSESARNRTQKEETKDKIRKANQGTKLMNNGSEQHWVRPEEFDSMISKGYSFGGLPRNRDYTKDNNPMYGKKGEDNPNYGRVTVNNGHRRKKVKPEEVDRYLSEGWVVGWKFEESSTTIEKVTNEKDVSE